MAKQKLPEEIALCLSGGGYRAACFHLGALAYLDRVGLLGAVKMLSTVSGGTFTGAKFALSLMEEEPFQKFFRGFYQELGDTKIFTEGMSLLGSKARFKVPSQRRTLIKSMAQTYCETFFARPENGEPYLFGDVRRATTQLEEITFNATDFRTGIAFRFQKSKKGKIGNYYKHISEDSADKLRLGDVVAASSCFPGGFEPINFPHDFGWPKDEMPEEIKDQFKTCSIPLMDGGVYDNQGIDSLMLAEQRTDASQEVVARDACELDMFLISDTDRQFDELYRFPDPPAKSGWLHKVLSWLDPPLWGLNVAGYVLQGFCLVAIFVLICGWGSQVGLLPKLLLHLVPIAVALITCLAVTWIRDKISTWLLPLIPELGRQGWKSLRRLKISQALDMVNLRLTSLLAMTSHVFMKRIRSLGYRIIFTDTHYDGKRMANLIYHLCEKKKEKGKEDEYEWFFDDPDGIDPLPREFADFLRTVPRPCPALRRVAERAAAVETKLWFDAPWEQPTLVAAGQATTCFNLMKFVARNYEFDVNSKTFKGGAQRLWEQLLTDWKRFIDHPYALLREVLDEDKLPLPPI